MLTIIDLFLNWWIRGAVTDACPSRIQLFFNFMQFPGKNDRDNRLAFPPLGLAPLPPCMENVGFATVFINTLLPPTNEVWSKVMFLHLCVILFTGWCWLPSMHHWSHDQGCGLHPGGLHPRGLYLGSLHPGGSASRGVCLQVGVCIQGRWADPYPDTMGYGQGAGGTHPTGMHSCWFYI